uniref:Uncharacterized protein n=1 Tax=Rhizophora mucronata TaxID=61149 RepID=A0A2P2L3I3_RHIMU
MLHKHSFPLFSQQPNTHLNQ